MACVWETTREWGGRTSVLEWQGEVRGIMRGGGRGGEGEGERNSCQAADKSFVWSVSSTTHFFVCMCVCVFSGLGAHSDGIRHQRNISRHSWINRGEEDHPGCHQCKNVQLSGFCMWTDGKKDDIRNQFLFHVSVCVWYESRYSNETKP